MAKNWVVVANTTEAKIFTPAPPARRLRDPEEIQCSAEELPPSQLVELEALEHPAGRLKPQSIDRGPSGQIF